MNQRSRELEELSNLRMRVTRRFSLVLSITFVCFLVLACYSKVIVTKMLVPGLSVGVVLGVFVLFGAWFMTYLYMRWANGTYDSLVEDLRNS